MLPATTTRPVPVPAAGVPADVLQADVIEANVFQAARRAPRSFIGQAGRVLLALCGVATVLMGCPLYSDSCDGRSDCASGFYCEQFSQRCQPILDPVGCVRPSQCEVGETCTPDFACRPGSCDFHGCVRGYTCGVVDSSHTCVLATVDAGPVDASVPDDAAVGGADASSSADGGVAVDAGDAGLGSDAGP